MRASDTRRDEYGRDTGSGIPWGKIMLGVIAAAPVLALAVWFFTYRGIIAGDENVQQKASQVQNQLQRAADLIPNLVETVKAGAGHENQTLTNVINARSNATRPIVLANGQQCAVIVEPGTSVPKCSAEQLTNDPAAQRGLIAATQAIGGININALREAYPNLKAVGLFVTMMAQLEGNTNRVAVARRDHQLAVSAYNTKVRQPPGSLVASYHGFTPKTYFEAAPDAQTMPKVKY